MSYTNMEMDAMRESAARHLGRRDIVGYACARNIRALESELKEYLELKDALIIKHGAAELDEQGAPTGSYRFTPGSESYEAFLAELGPYMTLIGEPRLMTLDYSDAIDRLTGAEIIELEWMFADKQTAQDDETEGD